MGKLDTAWLTIIANGDEKVARDLLAELYPVNRLEMAEDPSGCSAKITVWPNGLSDTKHYHFENVGESVAECIILCLKDIDRYRESGTNYQIKE